MFEAACSAFGKSRVAAGLCDRTAQRLRTLPRGVGAAEGRGDARSALGVGQRQDLALACQVGLAVVPRRVGDVRSATETAKLVDSIATDR
jgi:hypothetical protein